MRTNYKNIKSLSKEILLNRIEMQGMYDVVTIKKAILYTLSI